jgi:hypothetical protein
MISCFIYRRPLFLLLAAVHPLGAVDSALWQDFVDAVADDRTSTLPDFSHAGYGFSETPIPDLAGPIYNVTAYGAVADDGQSDRDAIQAAVDAVETAGGGIVLFPAGVFHLNTAADAETPIIIRSGGVVLRGAGRDEGGTSLLMERNLEALDENDLTSTPFMIQVKPTGTTESVITTVTGFSRREGRTLTVANAGNLSEGQWITLSLRDPDAVPAFLHPYTADELWTRLETEGIQVKERHRIASISGQVLTLAEPLHVEVDPVYDWEIRSYPHVEGIGFEDIRFVGGWTGPFVHHRSALDDGGWSGLEIDRAVHSWVRRCVFENWNYGIQLDSCSAFSVQEVSFEGAGAHYGVHTRRGYGVLIGPGRDLASHYHGPSMGYQSSGAVYWRFTYSDNSSFDAHTGTPVATLLDRVEGGLLYGRSGGTLEGQPNHLGQFVLWNFKQVGGPVSGYDFWREDPEKKDRFVKPIVSGLHGETTTFREDSLEALESPGVPVDPASLFEAQLAHRLGALPQAINDLIDAWDSWVAANPPPPPTDPVRLMDEPFYYPDGPLAGQGDWSESDNTASRPNENTEAVRVKAGRLQISMDPVPAEGALRYPFASTSIGQGSLYAGLLLRITGLPSGSSADPAFFSGFSSSTGNSLRSRLWVTDQNPANGEYRLGVTSVSGSRADIVTGPLLEVGVEYLVVLRLEFGATGGTTSFWIDPVSESDEWFEQTGSFSTSINSLFFRQDDRLVGNLEILRAVVGESFEHVLLGKESSGSSYLVNLSTRGAVAALPGALIAGFVMSPTAPEAILARGIGPALAGFGVDGTLEHAALRLADFGGMTVEENSGWSDAANATEIEAATTATGAFALVPGSKDAAMLIDLSGGLFTARLKGANGEFGIGLVELYPVAPDRAELANISTRGLVGTGAAVIIPGFVVGGDRPQKLLIRGVGPSLGSFGVEGFLEDPQLVVLARDESVRAQNDDWGDSESASEIASIGAYVGAFPLEDQSADAAVVVDLEPGSYTALVSGVNEGTGIALVEVYAVD